MKNNLDIEIKSFIERKANRLNELIELGLKYKGFYEQTKFDMDDIKLMCHRDFLNEKNYISYYVSLLNF